MCKAHAYVVRKTLPKTNPRACFADSYGVCKKQIQNSFRFRSWQNRNARPYGNVNFFVLIHMLVSEVFYVWLLFTRRWNLWYGNFHETIDTYVCITGYATIITQSCSRDSTTVLLVQATGTSSTSFLQELQGPCRPCCSPVETHRKGESSMHTPVHQAACTMYCFSVLW